MFSLKKLFQMREGSIIHPSLLLRAFATFPPTVFMYSANHQRIVPFIENKYFTLQYDHHQLFSKHFKNVQKVNSVAVK